MNLLASAFLIPRQVLCMHIVLARDIMAKKAGYAGNSNHWNRLLKAVPQPLERLLHLLGLRKHSRARSKRLPKGGVLRRKTFRNNSSPVLSRQS